MWAATRESEFYQIQQDVANSLLEDGEDGA
jgi:hypothetical protein